MNEEEQEEYINLVNWSHI